MIERIIELCVSKGLPVDRESTLARYEDGDWYVIADGQLLRLRDTSTFTTQTEVLNALLNKEQP